MRSRSSTNTSGHVLHRTRSASTLPDILQNRKLDAVQRGQSSCSSVMLSCGVRVDAQERHARGLVLLGQLRPAAGHTAGQAGTRRPGTPARPAFLIGIVGQAMFLAVDVGQGEVIDASPGSTARNVRLRISAEHTAAIRLKATAVTLSVNRVRIIVLLESMNRCSHHIGQVVVCLVVAVGMSVNTASSV